MSRNPHRAPDRMQDMLEAIGNARSDLGEIGKTEFMVDGKAQRAVIESLIIIGEATNKIHIYINTRHARLAHCFVSCIRSKHNSTHEF